MPTHTLQEDDKCLLNVANRRRMFLSKKLMMMVAAVALKAKGNPRNKLFLQLRGNRTAKVNKIF